MIEATCTLASGCNKWRTKGHAQRLGFVLQDWEPVDLCLKVRGRSAPPWPRLAQHVWATTATGPVFQSTLPPSSPSHWRGHPTPSHPHYDRDPPRPPHHDRDDTKGARIRLVRPLNRRRDESGEGTASTMTMRARTRPLSRPLRF